MNVVCAGFDDGIELTRVRVPELRAKLIRKSGEFLDRIVRDGDQRPSHALVVIVDAFNREIVVSWTLSPHRWTCAGANSTAGAHAGLKQG